MIGDEKKSQVRKSSFNSKLRKGSTCNLADDALICDCPGMIFNRISHSFLVERQIRFFVDYCPSLDPSLHVNVIFFFSFIHFVVNSLPKDD